MPDAEPVDLPPESVAGLARRLGLPAAPALGTRWVGATSTVVRLGDDLLVKVPHLDDGAVSACLTHARVSPAARRLGVRAPDIVAVVEAGDLAPVPLVISRFVPGEALSAGEDDAGIWEAVGRQIALLHAAAPDAVPPGLRSFTQHPEVDPATVVETLQETGRISHETAATLMRIRDRLAPHVLPDDAPVFCHGDLHVGNVIASEGRYSGLVDLAGAGWLDAAWDFVGIPAAAVPPMITGYGTVGGRTDSLLERIGWCRFQLAVHRLPAADRPEAAAARAVQEVSRLLAAG